MRFIPVLLISVALATASGCFGKDDENGDGTTTTPTGTGTTPTGSGSTTPTGATPTSPTTGGNNTGTTTPAPRELCAVSFNFQQNVQPGPPPTHLSTGSCGTVPAGYRTLKLMGNFTTAEPVMAIAPGGLFVDIVDAAGTAVLTCAGPSAPGPAAPVTCDMSGAATAGDYTLAFRGQGNMAFSGTAMIS